jgi:hypothetical protein
MLLHVHARAKKEEAADDAERDVSSAAAANGNARSIKVRQSAWIDNRSSSTLPQAIPKPCLQSDFNASFHEDLTEISRLRLRPAIRHRHESRLLGHGLQVSSVRRMSRHKFAIVINSNFHRARISPMGNCDGTLNSFAFELMSSFAVNKTVRK